MGGRGRGPEGGADQARAHDPGTGYMPAGLGLAGAAEGLSGAELEQVVGAALFSAFAARRELSDEDLANAIVETAPLYDTDEARRWPPLSFPTPCVIILLLCLSVACDGNS